MRSFFTLAVALTLVASSAEAVEKSERDLLVVTNLVTHGKREFAWLYKFLNVSSVSMARTALKKHYRKIHVLAGARATKASFTESMMTLSSDPAIQALDVIVNVHGNPEQLTFEDGRRTAGSIRDELAKRGPGKLRLFYSTACFGASHADDLVAGGFRVANGARGVNANADYEYPVVLSKWRRGLPYGNAQKAGNHPGMIRIHGAAARAVGFKDVDSFKLVFGDPSTTIRSQVR